MAASRTQRIALMTMFAAISVVLDSVVTPGFSAGAWYGWVFLLTPTNGVILGPVDGFITTLISVMVGHTVVFRESVYEYVFTLGAPIAALIAGLVYRRRNVVAYFTVLLGAYFLSPVGRGLPIWGMWDVYLAYLILVVWTVIPSAKTAWLDNQTIRLALAAFIGLESDILFRIFILVPCGGYSVFYGLTPEALAAIWAVPAPLITPIKVAASMILTPLLVPRINEALSGFNMKLD